MEVVMLMLVNRKKEEGVSGEEEKSCNLGPLVLLVRR